MEIKEEALDYFRDILIDLEVSHVAIIDKLGHLDSVPMIEYMDQKYLTNISCLQSESDLEKGESLLVKFEYKSNFLQITINPKNTDAVYYYNPPENPELIFAQPYDFLITSNWMFIFLPKERIDLEWVGVLKAQLHNPVEKIEAMNLKGRTPKDVLAFLENLKDIEFHDIRTYDQRFCDYFGLIEEFIEDLEVEDKMAIVQKINTFANPDELLLEAGKIASDRNILQLSYDFLSNVEEDSEFYGKAMLEMLNLFDTEANQENMWQVIDDYPFAKNVKDHDQVMNLISKMITVGSIDRSYVSEEFNLYYDKWLHAWTEISVDPLWVIFDDKNVHQFIDEQLKPKNREHLVGIIKCLVTDYYHKFTAPTTKPYSTKGAAPSWESELLTSFFKDKYLTNKMKEEVGDNQMAFGRLLLHIDCNFICGEVYNGYKGYKNRRDMMEQEGKEFAEDFLAKLALKEKKKDE